MRFSRRVPDPEPNAWARAPLLDLTDANPTRVGLAPSDAGFGGLADAARAPYDPDPRGERAARAAVARYLAERGGAVHPDHVVVTSGTSEAYAHLFRLLADPGDRVLVPSPSYPLFEPIARAEGLETHGYRLVHDGRWHLDVESLGERGARAVVLVEPNHPTGSFLDAAELARVEAWCERHEAALVVDEVFGDFRWEGGAGFPTRAGRDRVPTFVLGGLAKVCGLPQMKASWIAASGPADARDAALARLEWLADLFLSVSTPAQRGLPEWLAHRHSYQGRVRERVARNRGALGALVRARPEVTPLGGEGGWAIALRLPARRDEAAWVREAFRRDVVVHPGHFYDFELEPVIVLSLLVTPDVWDAGLARLAELLGA